MKTYDERTRAVLQMVADKKKKRGVIVASVSSAAACLFVLVMGLVLFLPFGTPAGNSPYQNVLNAVYRQEYHNNWELWTADLGRGVVKGIAAPGYALEVDGANNALSPEVDSVATGEAYIENTNLQVADVKEGDVLKESTHYFYRLCRPQGGYEGTLRLNVYAKAGADSALVGTFDYTPAQYRGMGVYGYEMYLSADASAITLVCTNARYGNGTVVATLDVSAPDAVKLVSERYVSGRYVESRQADGRLLLVTDYDVYQYDADNAETFVPYVEGETKALTEPEQIVCPDEADYFRYTVLTLLDGNLDVLGQAALLGCVDPTLYVNADRAYVVDANTWHQSQTQTTSNVCVYAYGADGLRLAARFDIEGRVEDQYWLDEYEGVLRVATTVRETAYGQSERSFTWDSENASLFCYSVQDWRLIGAVRRFAPEGESVQSARFVGTKAYICTAEVVRFTDPVYCFDLSDYAHITYTDTGAIDGYSSSLVPFADDALLGIGVLRGGTVKFEVYREAVGEVQSLATLTLGVQEQAEDVYIEENYNLVAAYKSYLLAADEGIVGVPCQYVRYVSGEQYEYKTCGLYVLVAYREGSLAVVGRVPFDQVDENTRAVLRDGYVYLFSADDFEVLALADLQ